MTHEIYYTSAPEGLKRGSHGFCTVAATDGLPKPLWERLEALSGYRNHFEAGRGRNPVLHAHWLISLAGKEYHVLSRICDSGSDYTQRTNAFAHHLALESTELPPAGPAWLIAQPAVMAQAWDSRVGPIVRPAALPWQDESPAICRAWQQAAGDPGWAGVLAETFFRSHTKPVCILFNPDQDMLPLLADALRLLPPNLRWTVTFNTYFTSMPSSATCLWRCCLAGTPAASASLRYAANGLVLNLTDVSRLGTPANSPWVQMARTGIPIIKAPVPVSPPAKPTAPPPPPPSPQMLPRSFSPPPAAPPPVFPPPAPTPPIAPYHIPVIDPDDVPIELVPPPNQLADAAVPIYPTSPEPTTRKTASPALPGGMIQVVPPPPGMDSIVALERAQRRTKFAVTLVLALFAVAIGAWLLVLAFYSSTTPSLSPTPRVYNPEPLPPQPTTTPTVIYTPLPALTQPVNPIPPLPINPLPLPPTPVTLPTPLPITPLQPPRPIYLRTAMDMRTTPSGIRDRVQSIAIPPDDFDDLKDLASLSLTFPADKPEYVYKNGEIAGLLTTLPDSRIGRPGLIVRWKDHLNPANSAEVVAISIDKTKSQLEFTWRTSTLLKRADVVSLAFWVVQNSTLVAADPAKARPQKILLKPLDLPPVSFLDPNSKLTFPADIPALTAATIRDVPPGWQADWFVDWESRDPRQRTPANASQVIRLKKTTGVNAIDAAFILTFRPGWTFADSNFAKRQQADQSDLNQADAEIARLTLETKHLQDEANADLAPLQAELKDRLALQGLSASELARQNLTAHALELQIEDARGKIDQRTAKLNDDLTPLKAKLAENEQLARGYRASVAAYAQLNGFNVTLELPDGLPIAVLPFQRRTR